MKKERLRTLKMERTAEKRGCGKDRQAQQRAGKEREEAAVGKQVKSPLQSGTQRPWASTGMKGHWGMVM